MGDPQTTLTNAEVGRLSWRWGLALVLPILAVGLGCRLVRFTDWPTRFHPMLQYENAVTTRVIWLRLRGSSLDPDEALWLSQWQGRFKAPPVLETLTALTYLAVGEERPWVAVILTTLAWFVGGWFLFDLSRRFSGSELGGLLSLGFYVLTPFGIVMSRSFQHEALMMAAGLFALWCLARFRPVESFRAAAWAGIVCGLAAAAKPGILLFVLAGGYFGLAVGVRGLRRTLFSPELWTFLVLLAVPSFAYAYFFLRGEAHQLMPALLVQPVFYYAWSQRIAEVVSWPALIAALIGTVLAFLRGGPLRWFVPALLLGYMCYALVFTYATATHNYYLAPLMLVVAIGLAPLAGAPVQSATWDRASLLIRGGVVVVVAALAVLYAWPATDRLRQENDAAFAPHYVDIGRRIGRGSTVLALTWHEGLPLSFYGWLTVHPWPDRKDKDYLKLAHGTVPPDNELLGGFIAHYQPSYFVVTRVDEFHQQPRLEKVLNAVFALYYSDDDVLIYDLRARVDSSNRLE
jgi:hypothetical protein